MESKLSASRLVVWVVVLVAAALTVGCASTQNNLAKTDIAFTQTVKQLPTLKSQGLLTQKQAAATLPYVQQGSAALDASWAAFAVGDTATANNKLSVVNAALAALLQQIQRAQRTKP